MPYQEDTCTSSSILVTAGGWGVNTSYYYKQFSDSHVS